MRYLLTNDDGIYSEGLKALHDALVPSGEVWVFAPDRERSAVSHALTLDRPLRVEELRPRWCAVSGTPTDCVNLGATHFMRAFPPDLVVSGINIGLNVGDDVTYSGTVSAAFEASILGLHGFAFSQEMGRGVDLERSAAACASILAFFRERGLVRPGGITNVNIPAGRFGAPLFTRLGKRHYQESIVEKLDPRGRKYYWIGGEPVPGEPDRGTDFEALHRARISITPLHLDLTEYPLLQDLRALQGELEAAVDDGR
jgi:5'-nucleotidase